VNQPLPLIETLTQQRPGELGSLSVHRSGQRVALPLAAYRVVARAAARIAEVTVEQSFQNPFHDFLEAVYIFPLSGAAAVSEFELKVGERTLKAVVKERSEARQDYLEAVGSGKRAALLEQDRDNVFTVQVGNLPPGETVSVRIVYSERLSYFEDGNTELRVPLVVAPRYIPGEPIDGVSVGGGVESDTDAVPDASRITPPRFAPGFDPKVALSIEVEVADGQVDDMACSQHAVKLTNGRIALSREDEPLNRDFVLRWRLAKSNVQSRLLVNRGGYAMLSLTAPRRSGFQGVPRDVIFILDRSGSMQGIKMASAARACSILLATLGPQDKFAVCEFSDTTDWMMWTPAEESGIAAGEKFLRGIEADGGTELGPALEEAMREMRARNEVTGRAAVIVLITDGEVGNEAQIYKLVQRDNTGVRVFTIGIDTAVNDAFLQRLSKLGGGTCTLCVPGEALEHALASVGRDIGAPVITELRIDEADLLAPSRTPDLFAGRASTSFFVGHGLKHVRVRGKFQDGTSFDAKVQAEEIDLPGLAHLWARARVADLEDRFRLGQPVKQEIVDIAVKHTLLTRFTAFVVVDESETVNADGTRRTVVQPVEMPERWQFELQAPFMDAMPAASSDTDTGEFFEIGAAAPSKLFGATFGGKTPVEGAAGVLGPFRKIYERNIGSPPDASALKRTFTSVDRAVYHKAVAILDKLLKDVRRELDMGVVPAAKPVEEVRKAVIQVLARSSLLRMGNLKKFLHRTLVELIGALASGSTADVRPVLDRVEKELDGMRLRQNFWEAGV